MTNVGIVGVGTYLPQKIMTARDISVATQGVWTEQAVIDKLGVRQKHVPTDQPCDGTQEMGALASLQCLKNTGVNPLDIDVILCMTEEWKEYPLTTSACYVQERIGAKNAWCLDVQNRCCSCVSAMKLAKDLLIADEEVNVVLICGGYRNCDLIDYTDGDTSFLYDLGAGGGAMILKKNYGKNLLLGTHLMSDGAVVHTCGVKVGGVKYPVLQNNLAEYGKFRLMDLPKMKAFLNAVSVKNWRYCIERALTKSNKTLKDVDYLDILHIKPSKHREFLDALGLSEKQTIYLQDYGHVGQIDQILSLELALKHGKVKDGSTICMVSAGIGYTWSANVVEWG